MVDARAKGKNNSEATKNQPEQQTKCDWHDDVVPRACAEMDELAKENTRKRRNSQNGDHMTVEKHSGTIAKRPRIHAGALTHAGIDRECTDSNENREVKRGHENGSEKRFRSQGKRSQAPDVAR